jgi:adenylate cyclase
MRRCQDGHSDDPEADGRKSVDLARRALQSASDDPHVLASAAMPLAYFGEDIGATIALVDRALMLNPNSARSWYLSGVLRWWAGQPDLAIEHVETAVRFSPRIEVFGASFVTGSALFLSGRLDEAVPKLLSAIQRDKLYPEPYRHLAACYAHMGRRDDAGEIVARLRAITPIVMPSFSQFRNSEQRELLLSGLRLAAGEPE